MKAPLTPTLSRRERESSSQESSRNPLSTTERESFSDEPSKDPLSTRLRGERAG